MRQRGEADFAPSSVGRATGRETRLTSGESPPSERRLRLICDAVRRASGSPRERRPLLPQRGPATPPPAAAAVPRPHLPTHDAPAEPWRTSQRRAAMRGAAAAMAASSGPPRSYTVASERPASGAGGCWPQAAPAPGAELTLISDVLASSRAQPESRRAVNSRARERVEDGGADLAHRGVGRARARPALGGAAGRLGARAAALKRPKIAAAGLGDLESASLRSVRAPARLSRGSPACPGAVLTRGAERGAAAVEPGPWRLRDEPNRAPRRWRSKQSPAAARGCAASPQRFCVARPRLS